MWATNERFQADLELPGIPVQRQYETRSTFRSFAMRAGASEFHLNLITHPKPRQASDFYTRLDMQWEEMCRVVLAIDPGAWGRASEPATATTPPEEQDLAVAPDTVTSDEVTVRVTSQSANKSKPPDALLSGGYSLRALEDFNLWPSDS